MSCVTVGPCCDAAALSMSGGRCASEATVSGPGLVLWAENRGKGRRPSLALVAGQGALLGWLRG